VRRSETELDPRRALRLWVASTGDALDAADTSLDRERLFEQRLLTSLHVPELILLIEHLTGAPVDVLALTAGDIASIDAIIERFFAPELT
jgi:hypothetical protein